MNFGTERVVKALSHLGEPQNAKPVIHVTGTNGKGSVCEFLTRICMASGLSVGTFTSPALLYPRECIRLNDTPISQEQFEALFDRIDILEEEIGAGLHDEKERLSSFERLTVAAFICFEKADVDIMVIEVGLGGLLDATNVFHKPLACILTSVSLEHEAILGSGIQSILQHKLAIGKPDVPFFIAPQDNVLLPSKLDASVTQTRLETLKKEEINSYVLEEARMLGLQDIRFASPALLDAANINETIDVTDHYQALLTMRMIYDPNSSSSMKENDTALPSLAFRSHLVGQSQLSNAGVALSCAFYLMSLSDTEQLKNKNISLISSRITYDSIRVGCESAFCAGRLEWLSKDRLHESLSMTPEKKSLAMSMDNTSCAQGDGFPFVLVDGAHNPAGALKLAQYLAELKPRIMGPSAKVNGEQYNLTGCCYILAVTEGKDVGTMAYALFSQMTAQDLIITVPFSAPVDMPWISCVSPSSLAEQLQSYAFLRCRIRSAASLSDALGQLQSSPNKVHAGAPVACEGQYLTVITGSLYLISEVHRLLNSASGTPLSVQSVTTTSN